MTARTPTLIGLPYDASSSFLRGAAAAPPLIRQTLASPAGNLWTEALDDLSVGLVLADAGDLELPPSAEARALIEEGIGHIMGDGGQPISLGGDHSVTYPILRAVRRFSPELMVLQIDAHSDLYDEFEGDRYSHACPFARIMEERLADRLVQVGIRAMTGSQRAQAGRFDVEVIDMRSWAAGIRPQLRGPIYLSIDIDAIDPAFAPGVAHREPGGLSVRDVLGLIQTLPGPVVGADVVELNPSRDPQGVTAAVCSKLVKEIAGRMLNTAG